MKDNLITKIKKKKIPIIVAIVIWMLGVIFLVAPIAYSIESSSFNGVFSMQKFIEDVFPNISSFSCIGKVFSDNVMPTFMGVTTAFTVIFLIACGIGIWKARKKGDYDKIEHGSSDWSQAGEQYRVLSKNSGIILAEDNYLPLDKSGNVNVLIVGGSGSGKSASYSIPNAHQLLGSYIFTDPKGEIYDITAGYLREQGYEIKLLNLVNPQSSDSYNPLFHVNSELDVDIIASTVVRGQKSDKGGAQDPFWDNMSELLLKALIYFLIATRPMEEQNLASCAELVRAANSNGESSLLSDLMSQLPYDHPARTNFKSVELASDKTYSSILSSLQSSLGKFDSKDIADVTSTNTIDFEEIATKKTALYVVSSDTHTAYDFLLTIFFSQMIQQLYDFADRNGGKLPVQAYFILDEFANIGQIPDFDKKISTSRSRGISFSVILQNLDQLKSIYEKSHETIIGNCDTHVFLGSNSYQTVEYFSKELGEKTISHNNKTVNRNNAAARQGFSESDQIMARALMTPDELRRMDNNECIIFEKGLKPIKAKKFWWFKKNNISNDLNKNRISHNDYKVEDRGEWRKFNPYNPYKESTENTPSEPKISSLDDLFDDLDDNNSNNTNNNINNNLNNNNTQMPNNGFQTFDGTSAPIGNGNTQQPFEMNNQMGNSNAQQPIGMNNPMGTPNSQINPNMNSQPTPSFSSQPANNSWQNNDSYDQNDIDLEKELEAKFDELFGTADD